MAPEGAIPATYRRAPRTERFILTGVGIGAIVGFIVGVILPAGTTGGRGVAGLLVGLAGALAGGLITGTQAAYMEYTSGRSADRQRRDIEAEWEGHPSFVPRAGVVPADAPAADAPAAEAAAADAPPALSVDEATAPAPDDDEGAK